MKEDFTKILNQSGWVIRLMLIIVWILPALSSFGMKETPLYDHRLEPPINVSGTVKDEQGQPLSGVSVKAVGTRLAVSTSTDGSYRLVGVESNATLEFSYVGFTTQRISVNNRTTINIVLVENASALDEVLVTGYMTTTKRDLTGAIGTVNVEDMQKAPVRSFEEALAGRVAGVQVTSQDGKPGSGINILIRGVGSITQDSSPLYVIDGFPIDDANNNAIDPNDVESITVLKDASATAIYGARGSNGVIVVTTKRGKAGKTTISYNGNYGISTAPKYIQLLNPFEFVQLQSLGYYTPSTSVLIKDASKPYFRDGRILEDYRSAAPTDWQDRILRTAPQNIHSLSLSGGTDKTLFSISGNITDQQGILIASDYSRYQGKVTIDQTINTKAKVGITAMYNNLKQTGQSTTGQSGNALFWSTYALRPVEISGIESNFEDLLYDPELPITDLRTNPVISAENTLNNNIQNHFNGQIYGQYQLTKDLLFKTEAGLNARWMRHELFNNSKTYSGGPYGSLQVNGSLRNYQYTQSLLRNSLNFQKTFNKVHRFGLFGAFEVQQFKIKDGRLAGFDLPNEELGISGIDAGSINPFPQTYSSSSSSAIVSGLMQTTYNYKSKYYLTGSIRTDGSSRFREQNRWGYFPSGSVKWKFSEEEFMKGLSFISDANIRTSYGTTGNNNVGDYASFSEIKYQSPLTINNTLQPNSAVVTSLDNPGLTWEKAAQFDIGLDLGFLKNKINLTAEYYKKNIYDLLFAAEMPGSSGYNTTFKNIGEISNEGFEFTLTTDNIKNTDFGWSSNFNISFVKNRLEALSSPDEEGLIRRVSWENNFATADAYIAKIGGPLGQIYGFISDGIYQVSDFDRTASGGWVLKPHVHGLANQQPGDPKYRDLDKNGIVNDLDRTVIGRGYPIHQGGFSNNFRYKNFDLNVFLQWSYGTEVVNANRIWFESGFGVAFRPAYNQFADGMDRWSLENQDGKYPRINANYVRGYSTDFVEDGSFIRLKTVNFGYNLPKSLLSRVNISRLRVYLAGTNLYTLTKYKGYDPEVSTYSNILTPGMDWSSYPRALTITAGVNLQF